MLAMRKGEEDFVTASYEGVLYFFYFWSLGGRRWREGTGAGGWRMDSVCMVEMEYLFFFFAYSLLPKDMGTD
jgi:hypothetical protein